MNDYYELLGVSPRATKAQIKAAFFELCKEYHPDKLPPGTPEKARRLVEEHFKKINEAYQVLSEQEPPQKHHADEPVRRAPTQAWQEETEPETPLQYRNIFNPHTMNSIAERLEHERQEIELDYQRRIKAIEQTINRRMTALGITPRDLKAMTGQGKITFIALYGLLALLSFGIVHGIIAVIRQAWIRNFPFLWLILSLISIVAMVGIFGFGLMTLKSLWLPVVNQATFNQAQKIHQELRQSNANAQHQRLQAQQQWQQELRKHIDFYKTVPIYSLTVDYVASLDAEHQFFLLQALRERADFFQLDHRLREVAQITISMGILNLLFGSTAVVK